MSEYTTLSSYLDALVAEKNALDNVDIDALVEERLSSIRAKITAEVEADVAHTKIINDAKISAIKDAIGIVARAVEEVEANEEEVSEVISEETY
jgi:hypothetical protein